ncbi:MAG: hypothetical protein NZ922_03830 [Candidatus Methanomethyliaceae archaeon]|nr:hypothetical protein [Candidatus Methanomethyliaceae archaeon]MDW7971202.1 hypothetical protein [Nitrososphaerota archaeon]
MSVYDTILSDKNLVKLFEHLIKKGKDVLVPEFDPKEGTTYPDVVEACNVKQNEVLEIINKLVALGLGNFEYHDQILRCPYCGAEHLKIYFYCPFCNSLQIYKEILMEHIRDGVIGPISKFKKSDGTLVCPSCGTKLTVEGKDYRTIGIWYRCLSCYRQFDIPKINYQCRICKKEMTPHGLMITSISKVIIKKEVLEEFANKHFVIKPLMDDIKNELLNIGFTISSPGVLIGKSGIAHQFSIVAVDSTGRNIVIDLITSKGKVGEGEILSSFLKNADVNPYKAIVIAIPGLTEGARKLATTYGINVVSGENPSEIMSQLKPLIPKSEKLSG